MLTCKTLYAGLLRHKTQSWPSHTLGKVTLRHLQHVASSVILPRLLQLSNPELVRDIQSKDYGYSKVENVDGAEYPEGKLTALSSPMGFGKTLVMLHFLITQCSHLKIIVTMPPHVLKCWISQLLLLDHMNTPRGMKYGYHADPLSSYALILHSSRTNHKTYVLGSAKPKNGVPPKNYKPVQGIGKDDIFQNHSLVLVTEKSLKGNHNDLLALADLLIVDECHKVRVSGPDRPPLYIGMSGETSVKLKSHQCLEIGHKVRVGPEVIPHIYKINNKAEGVGDAKSSKSTANSFFSSYHKDCLQILAENIRARDKVTLSIDGGGMGKSIIKWLGEKFPEYRQFVLKTSDNTVRQFEGCYGKAILIINTAPNEGLSIYTGAMIALFPELYSSTRLRQLRNRVTRPNSPFPQVHVIWICMGSYGYSKLRYVEYISHLAWNQAAFDSPSVEWLNKCEGIVRMLGKAPPTISSVDACIIYNHEHIELEEKLEFWLNYSDDESVLTEDRVRGMLGM